MEYVGYPNGLNTNINFLEKWINWSMYKPKKCHYPIYLNNIYCGETFYNVDSNGYASLDIKSKVEARKKGIASEALKVAITNALKEGQAKDVYVDPNLNNIAALKLYKKLGFVEKPLPENVEADETYREILYEDWIGKK